MLRPESVRLTVVPRQLLEELAAEAASQVPPAPLSQPAGAGNGQYTSRLRVDLWLTDRGVEYRVKPEPDGRGRTVYVLARCPFDPSHADPDACIMQDPYGKMSAQCFHNGCRGRGWQQFKQAIGPPERHHYDPPLSGRRTGKRSRPARKSGLRNHALPNGTCHAVSCQPPDAVPPASPPDGPTPGPGMAGGEPLLPTIQGNQRQLREVTEDALRALLARNDPPTLFQRGGVLTRLRVCEDNAAPLLEPLTDAALRGNLARVADWTKLRRTMDGGLEVEEAPPPMDAVKDLATLPDWPDIPVLQAVAETPVFTRTAELILTPGFHPQARLWYHAAAGLIVPEVPAAPTAADVERARHLLLVELLGDFPFEDDASKAHALAALLLPFVRQLIDGPTPMHLLDAPVEGTGKTLLASCISEVGTGRPVEAIAEASDDEEWRKRITAVLAEGPTILLLDNLNRILDSGALASVLTARVWKDRILGVSKTVRVPNLALWLASGNNTRLSRELIRRTVWCRLDSRTDAPWERSGFRHKNLTKWVKERRGELVWAALVLCQAWIAAGRPAGEETLGMFESWAETMGGILRVAGVPGLLANARRFRQAAADKGSEWGAFVAAWWARFGAEPVGVKGLFQLVTEEKLLDSVLGDKGEASQRIRLGLALGKARDRVVGEYRVLGGEEDHSCRQTYRLERVASQPPGTEAAGDTFELSG